MGWRTTPGAPSADVDRSPSLSPMYCPDCGYLNRPGAKYCAACQTPLGVASPAWRGPLQPGELMDDGRYQILRALGKGGMGAVYLAENLQAFGREVVIKEMLDYFDPNDPDQVERARRRFEDEARTLAALKHPSVPDIYGYFSQAGRNYLVMEFIVGENLETGVTHRDGDGNLVPALPYTQEQAIHFGVQLCDLLDYLASRKDPSSGEPRPVIHHDIKPANILRDPETDRVWLVDFGTARTRFTLDPTGQPVADKESVYGTVGYAPPEQYHGESEPRTDVYALAATLYHLLTDDDPRDHPFQFDRLAGLPTNLRLALENALAQDVTLRSTAAELKTALTNCMPDQPKPEAQPLVFPEGDAAEKLSDISRLAQKHWDFTRDILYSGDLDHWLRRSLHNPVVADTARRITTAQLDRDAGLDQLLRELDPQTPTGQLALAQNAVDLGTVTVVREATATVTLSNNGKGYSHGNVTASAGWLREADGRFGVRPGGSEQLVIQADTSSLTPGARYKETLTLTPTDGSKPLQLEITLAVAEPRIAFSPHQLTFDLAQGGADPQEITLTNTGGDQVKCALTRDDLWLVVQPKELTLPPGQGAVARVAIRPDRLPPVSRPRTDLTLTPTHGPVATIPVTVRTGRKSAARLLIALPLAGLAVVLVLILAGLFSSGRLDAILPAPTSPAQAYTADQLDSAMVQVDSFMIGRFEVSNLQYARLDVTHPFNAGEEYFPVVNVTWNQAKLYCESLGGRLPTEEEWIRAAEGTEGFEYPWGNEFDNSRVNSDTNRDSDGLYPIDSFPLGATPSGIHHLIGNAAEWIIGPPGDRDYYRGGSWRDVTLSNRSPSNWKPRGATAEDIGFRCVKPLQPASGG